jgi:hypothetical protein
MKKDILVTGAVNPTKLQAGDDRVGFHNRMFNTFPATFRSRWQSPPSSDTKSEFSGAILETIQQRISVHTQDRRVPVRQVCEQRFPYFDLFRRNSSRCFYN